MLDSILLMTEFGPKSGTGRARPSQRNAQNPEEASSIMKREVLEVNQVGAEVTGPSHYKKESGSRRKNT